MLHQIQPNLMTQFYKKNLKPTMLGHFRPFPVIFAFWDFTKKTWFFNAENHMGPYTMLSFRGK